MLTQNQIIQIIKQRARKKGYKNFSIDNIELLNSKIPYQVIIIVKDFDLEEIYSGVREIIKSEKTKKWYRCWTKSIILAGDPKKIKKIIENFVGGEKSVSTARY